jgi:Fe-S oxidoreductase
MAERFSNLRVEEAIGLGAEVLATSCPYCIDALEESRSGLNYEDVIQVKDITEIIQEVIYMKPHKPDEVDKEPMEKELGKVCGTAC